jgi:tetratricopeptide (TPR) repeat protein
MHHRVGQPAEALRLLQQGRLHCEQLVREQPTSTRYESLLAYSWYWTGKLHDEANQQAAALGAYQRAAEGYERVVRTSPRHEGALANSYHIIGRLQCELGQPATALPFYEKSLRLREHLCAAQPDHTVHRQDLEGTRRRLELAQRQLREEATPVGPAHRNSQ